MQKLSCYPYFFFSVLLLLLLSNFEEQGTFLHQVQKLSFHPMFCSVAVDVVLVVVVDF